MLGAAQTIHERCLDDDTLAAYAAGALSEAALRGAEDHFDGCTACRELATALTEESPGVPSRIGRFTVTRVIGAGASGVVYAAEDPQLGRQVAIKLLYASELTDDRDQRDRLQREAQAMARIDHPNVVTVYELGHHREQRFIAMALCEGTSLRRLLRDGPRDWRRSLRVFLAAGEGLAAVHAAGILHRDFKPENVMVKSEEGVWLTDFGLARGVQSHTATSVPHTIDVDGSAHWGTPAYMAPKQLRGESLDERADAFSFCVALYEAIAGKRPFAGGTLEAHLASITQGPSPLRGVPRPLARVLKRGMAAHREQRYATMPLLLTALRHAAFPQRRWWGAGVLLALIIGGFWVYQRGASERAARTQLAAVWNAESAAALTQHLAPFPHGNSVARMLEDGFANFSARLIAVRHADRVALSPRASALRTQCLDVALQDLEARVEVAMHASAETVEALPALAERLPSPDECALTQALVTPLPSEPAMRKRIDAVNRVLAHARALNDAGRPKEARGELAPLASEVRAIDYAPLTATLSFERAMTFFWSDAQLAIAALRDSGRAAELGRDDRTRALVAIHTASAQEYLGQIEEAAATLEDAAAIVAHLPGDSEIVVLTEIIAARVEQGRAHYDLAATHAERALAAERARPGTSVATQARPATSTCLTRALANDGVAAVAACAEARALVQALYGDDHPRMFLIENGTAMAQFGLHHLSEAQAAAQRTIEVGTRTYGARHPMLGPAYVERGQIEAALGQWRAAAADFALARHIAATNFGTHHPEYIEAVISQASAEVAQHHALSALRLADEIDGLVDSAAASEEFRAQIALIRAQAPLQRDPHSAVSAWLDTAAAWFTQTPAWHEAELAGITTARKLAAR